MRMSDGSSDVCSSDHGRRQARPGHRQVRRMRSSPVHEQQAALAAAWQAAPRVAVLLPCYNEEAAIGQVVRDFRRALPEALIYVYDNASSDRTGAVAAAAGAIVVHEPPRGTGTGVPRRFADVAAENDRER